MQMIRKAKHDDINRIEQLVRQAGLQTDGIEQNVDNFLVMEKEIHSLSTNGDDQPLAAVVGFEFQQLNGLLRSFVINEKSDQLNILEIMRAVIDYSKKSSLRKLFLCTRHQQSVKLFHMLGFQMADETPVEMLAFEHYQNISNEQPVIMYYTF
ncbi:MAG TPA: GNAT family N-acetyltransferase [Bacillales bacterium]|nr:GNAT family N-acetyltransferase [Bacillales bacterium]